MHPALALAKSLERNDALTAIFWGLTVNILNQGRVAESLPWVVDVLDVANASGDVNLLISGHALACNCHFWSGSYTKVLEHADKVLDHYDDEKHHHLAAILHHDPKTLSVTFASICTWILGYPDRAYRLAEKKRRTHASAVTRSILGLH